VYYLFSLFLSEFSLSLSSSQIKFLCGVDLARLAPGSSKATQLLRRKITTFSPNNNNTLWEDDDDDANDSSSLCRTNELLFILLLFLLDFLFAFSSR
jgi:hypothetical protein